MASAWILEWISIGNHRALKEAPVYVISRRCSAKKVAEFAKVIYFNNRELFSPDSGLREMSRCTKHLEIHEGPVNYIGSNPMLMWVYTKDFKRSLSDDKRSEILTWTRPATEKWSLNPPGITETCPPLLRKIERPLV